MNESFTGDVSDLAERALLLNNEGYRQVAEGKHEAALVSLMGAVDIFRGLVQVRPDAEEYRQNLVGSLMNTHRAQRALRMGDGALASAGEMVEHCRVLAATRSETAVRNLGACLNTLGITQKMMAHRADAFASMKEALEVLWPLFLSRPRDMAPDVDIVLRNLYEYHEEIASAPPAELLERISVFTAALRQEAPQTRP